MEIEARDISDSITNKLTSGTGYADGCRYIRNQRPISNNVLGCSTSLKNEHLELYAIASGFNGGKSLTEFVINQLIVKVFKKITKVLTKPEEIKEALKTIFEEIVDEHFKSTHDDLTKRYILMEEIKVHPNAYDISDKDERIRRGATLIVILRIDDMIYVMNCGRSMAVAVTGNDGNAQQLNTILHENDDPVEVNRLTSINVEPSSVLNPTRAIGDLHRSHLYEEKPEFQNAKSAPVISIPDIYHYEVNPNWKYIVLLSDGVVQNLKEIGVENIAQEVSFKLKECNTNNSTAQSLVDEFSRKHQDAYEETVDDPNCSVSSQMEEMTIIFIKLINDDLSIKLRATVDTIESTSQSIQIPDYLNEPYEPYIDIPETENTDQLYQKVEKYFLSDDE